MLIVLVTFRLTKYTWSWFGTFGGECDKNMTCGQTAISSVSENQVMCTAGCDMLPGLARCHTDPWHLKGSPSKKAKFNVQFLTTQKLEDTKRIRETFTTSNEIGSMKTEKLQDNRKHELSKITRASQRAEARSDNRDHSEQQLPQRAKLGRQVAALFSNLPAKFATFGLPTELDGGSTLHASCTHLDDINRAHLQQRFSKGQFRFPHVLCLCESVALHFTHNPLSFFRQVLAVMRCLLVFLSIKLILRTVRQVSLPGDSCKTARHRVCVQRESGVRGCLRVEGKEHTDQCTCATGEVCG